MYNTNRKIYIFDGVARPVKLKVTRGDTGKHLFSVWFVDSRGKPVEPVDLTGYTFAMQVRKYPRSTEILINVPIDAFSISQSAEAAKWEEDNEDVQGRQNLLTIKVPKDLTKIDSGMWWYDVEFYPPDSVPEEKYTYARGPYLIEQDTTIPNE